MNASRTTVILGIPLVAHWNSSGGWHLRDAKRRPHVLAWTPFGWTLARPLDGVATRLEESDLPAVRRLIVEMCS